MLFAYEWSFWTQFRVFPIATSIDTTLHQKGGKFHGFFIYIVAQKNPYKIGGKIFRTDIEL